MMRRYFKAVFTVILLACLLSSAAFAAQNTVITVAYIDYHHFISKTGDGTYVGYGAEYLKRIARYTGWTYKFVHMDWPTAYAAVKAGKVDFYCVARQTDARLADFDFSLHPVCNEEMNLYTLPDKKIYYEDYRAIDGLKIGMLKNSGEIDAFWKYAQEKGFTFTLVEYPMNEAAVDALHKGAVDAIALVNYSVNEPLKLIGNFGVSPAYLMSRKGSTHMEEFSKAQQRLFFDAPTFLQDLEKSHYGEDARDSDPRLTREEADYIAAAGPLTVALSTDMAPIEYYDKNIDAFRGVTVDLYRKISELTGLRFRFVRREDAPILRTQMEKGEVCLVGAMARNAGVASALKLTQTRPFSESSFSLVTKDASVLSPESAAAVPAGYPMFAAAIKNNGYHNLRQYGSMEACIDAVSRGKAAFTYMISMCVGYLLDHVQYAGLRSMIVNGTEYGICLGVAEATPLLLSIINKSIAVTPGHDINTMIIANTMMAKPEQTVFDFTNKNIVLLMIVGMAFIALAAFTVIRTQKARHQQALNQKLQQHNDFLQHLYNTIPCGVFQYRYEAPHNILTGNAGCARIYGYENPLVFIGKTPAAVVAKNTEDGFLAQFALCEKKGGPVSYTWQITRKDGTDAFTECVLDVVETGQGKVFQEVFIDVTERIRRENEIKTRYMQELGRTGDRDEGLLLTACVNIVTQTLVRSDPELAGTRPGMSIEAFLDLLTADLHGLQSARQVADFRQWFSPEKAKTAYENGHIEDSCKFYRRHEEQLQWLRADISLRLHPDGDLLCFIYLWDNTDEQVSSGIMRHMALTNCDSFMCIDTTSGRCLQYEVDAHGALMKSEASYGKTDLLRRMMQHMAKDDAEELDRTTDIAALSERLSGRARHQVYATLTDEGGERQDKALTYFYLDRDNGILAATINDVTEVRAGEVRHARLLANALETAEKADAAKSRFLSQVSHEMRTPLNAIIGFIELAKNADKDKVAQCLGSSALAAKQLLNVINDVLDMSSIESGKMKIAHSIFNFRHLISSITNVYGTQCEQKGIAFETKISTPMEDWLIGDELRVNQILMNLLGNAVKFTGQGHVWLTISRNVVSEDKVFIHFTVSDTGCGMPDEMLARLFKPFEQESATTARKFGGSGLGLSIVKSLVSMMDGTIRVESRQGEGSTFVCTLPFRRSDIGQKTQLPESINTLRILAVDDDELEREYMSLVLTRMGVRFTCVGSGSEALSTLEAACKEGDPYNVCLIDWCMPDMNGIEATSNIRKAYGEDMVVIVVSAYDFQQADDKAKEAGANMFLAKPIFQSSLFDLFMTLTGGEIAAPREETQVWDFSGRRVLLVEDNALNQIVAKGYLDKYHVDHELAENGQEAVEMFTASAPGHYDAVLMDIQMPVMDGYEATRAIRASSHPEAKTMQIIAQSADAFNEDIARALSSGMDAHVAKPIRQEILVKALHKAFSAGRNA